MLPPSSYLWGLSGSPSASLLRSALLLSRDGSLVLGSLAHGLLLGGKKTQRGNDQGAGSRTPTDERPGRPLTEPCSHDNDLNLARVA